MGERPYARPSLASICDRRRAHDAWVGEDIEVVPARRGELGHDCALVTRLEPVQRVGWDRELLTGTQGDLLAVRPHLDAAATAAEGLLFPRRAVEWRMPITRPSTDGV